MDQAIIDAERGGTSAMLAIIGDDYVITRAARTRSASGGITVGAETTHNVRMIVDAGDSGLVRNTVSRNTEGQSHQPLLSITAAWNADLQEGDTFMWNGRKCTVDTISVDHEADTSASAVFHG